MTDTGVGVAEWLRHLGRPNPLPNIQPAIAASGGGKKKKRRKRKSMKKRKRKGRKSMKRKN